MALLDARIDHHARALWQAERSCTPLCALTDTDPTLDVADAYAIQTANIERRLAEGRLIRGRKVGLSSRAMQEMLGVDEPDFGVLLDDMVVEDGDEVHVSELCQPRVEAEIAFVLATDLAGPGVGTSHAMLALAGVMPSLEIIDSRVENWNIRLVDTIADNASSARVVVGGKLTPVAAVDLRLLGMALYRNGEVCATGAGAAVLGNPVRCVAWLANKLAEFGAQLYAGDIVLPGALHRAVPVEAGDTFRAEFARLGAVTTRFV
ncbi:MAG: 2-keto-4-pentenoate hydratase [Egibacteraceae bacterium]